MIEKNEEESSQPSILTKALRLIDWLAKHPRQILTSLLLLLIFVSLGSCCGSKGRKGKGKNPPQNSNPTPSPNNNNPPKQNAPPEGDPNAAAGAKKLLGDGVNVSPYDPSAFKDAGGGPVSLLEELNCDFSSSCCYRNEQPPIDTLEWNIGEGTIDDDKLQKNFKTTEKPTEKFLIVSTDKALAATDNATFSSCSISCTKEPIKFTVRHWTTNGVQLQVCTKADFFGTDNSTEVSGCQDVTQDGQPGPSTYMLPPGDYIKIVIVAKNFVDPEGSAAMIDDIKVEYVPCGPSSTPAPIVGGGECNAVCNFESGTCSFLTVPIAVSGLTGKEFKVAKGRLGNKLTGVPKAAQGDSYAGVELGPNEMAALAADVNLSEDRVIKFQTYDSTDHIIVEACCDAYCTYRRQKIIQADDHQWKSVGINCPKGTKKFSYTATNSGYNYGAVGFDDVQILKPVGEDPNAATESACGSASSNSTSKRVRVKGKRKKKVKRIRKIKKIISH